MRFEDLPRREQRKDLLRRLRRARTETEQYRGFPVLSIAGPQFIGHELPGPRLNVLNYCQATPEEIAAGWSCDECLRGTWPRRTWLSAWSGSKPGKLRCTLLARTVSPREICDAFDPPLAQGASEP